MDYLSEHQRALELAAAGKLLRKIWEDGELGVEIVRELGARVNHLEWRKFEASIVARSVALRLLDAGLGFVVGVLTARATGGGAG